MQKTTLSQAASIMGKKSSKNRFSNMTKKEISLYFRELQAKRVNKRGKNSTNKVL